jgi:two-component system, cell cycle sensor histidine kinase and response regulator CckA
MNEPIRILYIDDYPLDRELVRDALEKEHGGFRISEAASRAEFEVKLAAEDYDLVLSDFNILGFEGLQVLDAVRASAPHVPVVIVTGTGSEEVAVEAMKRGAADYVIKTLKHIQRLPQTIYAVLEKQHLHMEYERAHAALEAEHNLLRALIDNIPDFIYVKDAKSRFVLVNTALARFFGLVAPEEMLGKADLDYLPYELAAQYYADEQAILQSGESLINHEESVVNQAGNIRWLLTTKTPLRNREGQITGLIGLGRDITEYKRIEAQLLHSQKMESVGRLAGGIAHDFNNLLTALTGYADLALDALPPTELARADLIEIRKVSTRAAGLTRQLLAFASKQAIEPRVLNLNDLLLEIDQLLRPLISEDIERVMRLSPDLWGIQADPMQIEQVVVNLAINARDAMPNGGKLVIETANIALDYAYTRGQPGVTIGDYVLLAISDTGTGIDPAVQAHLFEPFFTTKAHGRGTGLGLAISYGIIGQHGGHIRFQSKTGHGTTFNIYLPRAQATADSPAPTATAPEVSAGTETILLVEDEPAVRALAARVLRAHGYQVLEAADGVEALRVANEFVGPTIHLLLTDVVMPQMGGRALAERLGAVLPGIKTLFISGYTGGAITHPSEVEPRIDLLQKPFSPTALAQKVRAVLNK